MPFPTKITSQLAPVTIEITVPAAEWEARARDYLDHIEWEGTKSIAGVPFTGDPFDFIQKNQDPPEATALRVPAVAIVTESYFEQTGGYLLSNDTMQIEKLENGDRLLIGTGIPLTRVALPPQYDLDTSFAVPLIRVLTASEVEEKINHTIDEYLMTYPLEMPRGEGEAAQLGDTLVIQYPGQNAQQRVHLRPPQINQGPGRQLIGAKMGPSEFVYDNPDGTVKSVPIRIIGIFATRMGKVDETPERLEQAAFRLVGAKGVDVRTVDDLKAAMIAVYRGREQDKLREIIVEALVKQCSELIGDQPLPYRYIESFAGMSASRGVPIKLAREDALRWYRTHVAANALCLHYGILPAPGEILVAFLNRGLSQLVDRVIRSHSALAGVRPLSEGLGDVSHPRL